MITVDSGVGAGWAILCSIEIMVGPEWVPTLVGAIGVHGGVVSRGALRHLFASF